MVNTIKVITEYTFVSYPIKLQYHDTLNQNIIRKSAYYRHKANKKGVFDWVGGY